LAGIVRLLDAPRERLSRQVYNLHGLSISPAAVAAAVAARVAGARFGFEPDPQVDALIGGWPTVVDDQSARRDWGWAPRFDLDRLADDFIDGLKRER
jgi:nucleoside-diphosphate-sugar epimerase